MNTLPQTDAISNFKNKHDAVLSKLRAGPVLLLQRSKPAAVLVSPEEWDRTAREMKRLKRIVAADEALAQMRAGDYVSQEEYEAGLKEQGLD